MLAAAVLSENSSRLSSWLHWARQLDCQCKLLFLHALLLRIFRRLDQWLLEALKMSGRVRWRSWRPQRAKKAWQCSVAVPSKSAANMAASRYVRCDSQGKSARSSESQREELKHRQGPRDATTCRQARWTP